MRRWLPAFSYDRPVSVLMAFIALLVVGTTITTRLPSNAALYAPAPPRTGRRGRPHKKGHRLGALGELAATATWHTVSLHRNGATHKLRLLAVRFDGLLQVTDPDRLRETVRRGIGSGKGFGFGLLSLARPPM